MPRNFFPHSKHNLLFLDPNMLVSQVKDVSFKVSLFLSDSKLLRFSLIGVYLLISVKENNYYKTYLNNRLILQNAKLIIAFGIISMVDFLHVFLKSLGYGFR